MNRLLAGMLILLISMSYLQAQNKLAPAISYMLTHPLNSATEATYPSLFKIQEVNGYYEKTGNYQKGYVLVVYTKKPEMVSVKGIVVQSVLPKFVTAWFPSLALAEELSKNKEILYIDAPRIVMPNNDISVATSGAALLHSGNLNNTAYKGDNVLVGIFDTGIDWDHPDFRNASNQAQSRILRIWDQTITPIAGEASPSGFNYGVEYTQTHINNEIDGTPAGYVRENDINGHGTHVAGTAAGNGAALASGKYKGMAPNADIIIVKGGNGGFSSTNEINALTYFKNVATALGKPIVVNMSIGGQFGAHDGTNDDEVAVDNFCTSAAGRAVVIAAGNDNGSLIHRQVALAANGSGTITLNVPTAASSSSTDVFQFSMYVNNTNNVNATITVPGGGTVNANVGQSSSASVLSNTATVYYDNVIDASSGDRYINIYVTRSSTSANPSGTWTITLNNTTASALTIDGWLNYKGADFSSTNITSGDNNYLVGAPGTATNAITVASYTGKLEWYSVSSTAPGGYYNSSAIQDNISNFSSRGPRRDNVQKPNITANGERVGSCLSSDAGLASSSVSMLVSGLYQAIQGTSMATPEVTGCVALLLQAKNTATFTELKNAIANTATKDVFTGASSNNTWGSGKIDVYKAASSLLFCQSLSRITYSYDSSTAGASNSTLNLGSNKAATRFTPTANGKLGGVYFKTSTTIPTTSFSIEIRTNSAGIPGTLLGSMSITPSSISKFSWNYYDVSSLGISVTSGTDYFVVLVPGATDSWGIGFESLSSSARSSYFNGSSWVAYNDFRIRSVVYDNIPEVATAGNTQSICGSLISNALGGNTPINGTGTWSKLSGPGTVSFSAISSGNSTATVSVAGAYVFRWIITNGTCNSFADMTVNYLASPQGSLTANGPFCVTGSGQLTFTSTAGTAPFTLIYNDGVANRTVSNVSSGTPFNVFTSPVTSTTNYTLVSVADANCTRTTSFTGSSATITINPLPTNKTVTASVSSICNGSSTNIVVANSLATEQYQLRNNTGNVNIGSTIAGNGGSLNLPTGNLSSVTTFNVLATNIISSCGQQMNNTPSVSMNALPNVSNFGTSALNTARTSAASVTISSTSLASGTYTVTYNLSGANQVLVSTATMTFASNTGTFSTMALNDIGTTTITIISIQNASGCISNLSSANTASFNVLSINALLYSLVVNTATLSPAFSSTVISYNGLVSNYTTSVSVTPTKQDQNASIQVRINNGSYATVISGTTSLPLLLNQGSNVIEVKVTAHDGVTTKTYSVTINCNAILPILSYSAGTKTYATGVPISQLSISNTGSSVPALYYGKVTTLAGSGTGQSIDGSGISASFYLPYGIVVGTDGFVYVSDLAGNKIRKISTSGVVTTLAGTGAIGSKDTAGIGATFYEPKGLTFDISGNIYVADYGSNKIRKISQSGWVTTLAGSGNFASVDATGAAASFYRPSGVTVDLYSFVYVADYNNNKIRKISPLGVVTTFAGSGNYGNLDATGTAASFYSPNGIALDVPGNAYVADLGNNKIRKIDLSGVVTTIAGNGNNGLGSADGIGTAASFFGPSGLSLDIAGNIYVADNYNNKIRKISPSLEVSTLAGSGAQGSTDSIGVAASFNRPAGVATDAFGNLYVTDHQNNKIRKISYWGYTVSPALPAGLSLDSLGTITGIPSVVTSLTNYTITGYNTYGKASTIVSLATVAARTNANLSNLTISSGSLNPSFNTSIVSYTASVSNAVNSITVTPTYSDTTATIKVRINNGTYVTVSSGTASSSLSLNVGSNTIDVKVTAQDGTTIKTYTITITRAAGSAQLSITAFIEGLYLGSNTMVASPFAANGITPSNIADTIEVELHNATSPYNLAFSAKGTLSTTGTANIVFPASSIGNSYYLVIKHRNSIETWSALPISIAASTSYNFSSSISQAFGNNLSDMGNSKFAIYSGDINQDGSIDFADYPPLDLASQNGVLDYDSNDLNGDASVDFADYPLLDLNSSKGIFSMRP